MKKGVTILVPTDFSAAAKLAAHYAAQLAIHMKAKIILLSVIELETSTTVLHNWATLEKQMMKSAQRDLAKLLQEVKAKCKADLDITCDIASGVPIQDVIERYAIAKKANVIVMGTKGATGLSRILSGTITATVIGNSSIPVMAIPSKASFSAPRKFVYATDLKNLKAEIRLLSRIATQFDAEIMILHTISSNADKKPEPESITQNRSGKISFHQVRGNSPVEVINKFVTDKKADLLVMFTHELDFYEKLFGKSVTRTMAFQSHIPLLVYNRSKA